MSLTCYVTQFQLFSHRIEPYFLVDSCTTQDIKTSVTFVFKIQLSCSLDLNFVHTAFFFLTINIGSWNKDSLHRCLHTRWITLWWYQGFGFPSGIDIYDRIMFTTVMKRAASFINIATNLLLVGCSHTKCKT